uniref:Mediator of RNA polymerase II transcription subunit 14 n=1 Tax=Tanacetum cinerariifolium TaxID=118510 RepID=A0A6L2KED5_TANCI|nr:mediator of RNA polymerase II transcription subunit 14 [Tanacetum cinerariifolium]
MFFIHEGLQQARALIYDVPSAIEILLTGTYERLPKRVQGVATLDYGGHLTMWRILHLEGGQAWFYKGFDQLVIGLAWTFSLSAISSWFVVPCSALLLLLAPFLDMGWLMDSYLLIREGFAFEIKTWTTFFNISWSIGADISMIVDLAVWTGFTWRAFLMRDFVDNMCRDSHDLMKNHALLLMILEIGHRCNDFEYMVLLEDI